MDTYWLQHQLLTACGPLLADEDWDAEEHEALWDEFYPPKNKAQEKVMELTLMGKVVPEQMIEKARAND